MTELFHLCRVHWKWFIVSFVVICGYQAFKVLRTEPVYERTATLMVKEQAGGAASLLATFSQIGAGGMTQNVSNELAALKSPAVMLKVIEELGLNTSYYRIGKVRKNTLYGSNQPFTVEFLDKADDISSMWIKGSLTPQGEMTIKKSGMRILRDKYKFKEDLKFTLAEGKSDTLNTSVGRIVVAVNPRFKMFTDEEPFGEKKIKYQVTWAQPDAVLSWYENKLDASIPDFKSSIIDLTVKDTSAQRATDILNRLIDVYNRSWMDSENEIIAATAGFVDQRLVAIEAELRNIDSEISSYKQENVIPDIRANVEADMTRLNEAERQILGIQSSLAITRNILDFLADPQNEDKLLPVFSITGVSDAALEAQIAEYNRVISERNRLTATNSASNNPLLVDYDSRLQGMRRAIAQAISNRADALETRLVNLRREEAEATGRIAHSPVQANELLGIEREQKVKESLFLYLLERREENELSRAFTAYNTRMITPPMGPSAPIAPRPMRSMMMAFIFSMIVPVAFIYFRENFSSTVRSRDDIDRVVKAPFLGSVPLVQEKRHWYQLDIIRRKPKADLPSKSLVEHGNGSPVNEAFRMIRSNLDMMSSRIASTPGKALVTMVTSAIEGSGKTFVGINLASAFALRHQRVLIVDCDLRKATMSKMVGSPIRGITSILNGKSTIADSIVKNVDGMENIDMLPVGAVPPNPAELIDTPEFGKMIDELRGMYDVIILDCPPTEPVTDSQLISKYADRTVYVVRIGNLLRAFLPTLQEYYEEKRYNNMSIVLNGTDIGSSGVSGFGYGYGYGNKKS